jgi:bacillithiol system protein YtxJ
VTDPFLPLRDLDALEAALARADREPIIIFEHSPTCGISAQSHHELSDWLAAHDASVPAYLVDVRAQRALSAAIASRFGIRHESPQLLLVHGGIVRWHGSHWHVNADEVQTALEALALTAQG